MKTITYKMAKMIRAIAVSLIIMIAFSGITKGETSDRTFNEMTESGLMIQVREWMGSNANWNNESDIDEQDLALQMKFWIRNTTNWDKEVEANGLVFQMKSWMNNRKFWVEETENKNKELAILMN